MMENAYNVCNNASEPKQDKALMPKEQTETMTEIEEGTSVALETANDVLNFCLKIICFGETEENNKVHPECLMDLQRYNRELAQRVANKAIKIKNILVTD